MSKVLAIRFSALGDIAMAIPVLVSAARLSPDDEFTVLSRDYVAPLFAGLAPNIRFHGVDLKRQRYAGLTGMMNLYRDLKPEGFDKVVDLHDVLRTKQLRTFFSLGGAKVSHIDKERSRRRALVRSSNKRLVPLKTSFQRYADAFAKVGVATDEKFVSIFEAGRPDAPQLLPFVEGLRGRHWIGVAPFTTHRGKELPLPTTRQVVEMLAASETNHVFLFRQYA